ncbi:type II toxin-antitoxin system prevent-host-death family antitoxin [Candidatus Hamiltonella defensa]
MIFFSMVFNYGHIVMEKNFIAAGEFKAKCLKILDSIAQDRKPLVITKRGKAVAKLIPIPGESEIFGALRGSLLYEDDIVSPLENEWKASL